MLSTNEVGRRPSTMSGGSSQDTVGSHGGAGIDESDENRIIQSPPPPRRRRIRCLVPMLLAMFVVLVGVVAAPVAVFVFDGKGHILHFFKKNDTTATEISLAAVTRISTAMSPGSAATPSHMDAPQQEIVALSTPQRPKASHVTPGGQAGSSKNHGVTRRKDSNRERVYAPTVLGTSRRTTPDNLAEVQRLTEGVIVVPKGGVMSKLRAKEDEEYTTARRKVHRSRSSHAKEAKSKPKGATLSNATAGTIVKATIATVRQSSETGSAVPLVGAVGSTANVSAATETSTFSASVGSKGNGDSQSHSLSVRHNRRTRGQLGHRRRRGKRKYSTKRTTNIDSGSSSSSSGALEESSFVAHGSAGLEGLSLRDGHASMSIAVHRKVSNKKVKHQAMLTTRGRRSKKPRMLTSVKEKGTSMISSKTPSKLQASVATSVGRDGAPSSAKRETTISALGTGSTISSDVKSTKPKGIPEGNMTVTITLTKEPSSSSSRKAKVAPRNAIDSVPVDESHNDTVQPSISGAGNTQERTSGYAETSGYHELTQKSSLVSTTELYMAKSENPKLLHPKPSKPPSELVSTVTPLYSGHTDRTSLTNLQSIAVNHSLGTDGEKFVDFINNINDTIDDAESESATKHSELDEQNGSGFSIQSSNGAIAISPVGLANIKQDDSSAISVSVSTPKSYAQSETGDSNGFSFRKLNLSHDESNFSSPSSAVGGVTAKGNRATAIVPRAITANSHAPDTEHAAPPTSHTEDERKAHIVTRTSAKAKGNDVDNDSGSLLEMEVDFPPRSNRPPQAHVPPAQGVSASTGNIGRNTDSVNQHSTRQETSLNVSSNRTGRGEWFRDGGMPARSTTRTAARVVPSSTDVSSTKGSEKASSWLKADDDDDEDNNDEEETSSHSQANTHSPQPGPYIAIMVKKESADVRRSSSTSEATPASPSQRITKQFFKKQKTNVPERSSAIMGSKNADGLLRLSSLLNLNEVTTTLLASSVQNDQPAALINNPEKTNMPSPVPGNPTETPIVQTSGKNVPVTAPASHPATAGLPQSREMSQSTLSEKDSLSQRIVKLNSSLNNSDEGSIWRTIIPPKSGAASSMTTAAGLGVDNYYDDSKNDTSVGNSDASEGSSELKIENRRIAGEIGSTTRKPGGKADVFQTEYYYDDAPSSEGKQSTPADITEPGYGNAPEQEAIDDLFF